MAQEFCTTTHLLPICEQYACIHVCLKIYGHHSFGECKNPVMCRCYHQCNIMGKDGIRRSSENPPLPSPHIKNHII